MNPDKMQRLEALRVKLHAAYKSSIYHDAPQPMKTALCDLLTDIGLVVSDLRRGDTINDLHVASRVWLAEIALAAFAYTYGDAAA